MNATATSKLNTQIQTHTLEEFDKQKGAYGVALITITEVSLQHYLKGMLAASVKVCKVACCNYVIKVSKEGKIFSFPQRQQ